MSRLIKCENRHFYDADKWDSCPICNKSQPKVVESVNLDNEKTERMGPQAGGGLRPDIRVFGEKGKGYVASDDETVPINLTAKADSPAVKSDQAKIHIPETWNNEDEDKTVSLSASSQQEVCGWLVALAGKNRGRDYRIIAGKNFLGRSQTMDIVIEGDNEISREVHCSIIYDARKNEYWMAAGLGSMTYLNGELLRGQARIHTGDIIAAGKNEFMFVAFCEGDRTWKNI